MTRHPIQHAVVRVTIEPPQPRIPEIRQPRAELKAQQPEQAEHEVGIPCRVRDQLLWLQFLRMFHQTVQQIGRLAQRSRNYDPLDACELIVHELVIGDTALLVKILAIMAGIERSHRNHESQSVSRSDFTATPDFSQRNLGLGLHQSSVGASDGFRPNVILLHPDQPGVGEGGDIVLHHRFECGVADLAQLS